MPDATAEILQRLEEAGFRARAGSAMPFEEQLPLVTGVAWEAGTAQLALVAEARGPLEMEAWRQLLFAGSGIRHQLASDEASAFGTPVILAVVDETAEGELRRLAESLARDYAVFNRIDLNLVPAAHVLDPDLLEDALAPLLPRCRRILGEEISQQEVQQFWEVLRREVENAAANLDKSFGDLRGSAGREVAATLIGDSAETEGLPSPAPISKISARQFRSIDELELSLADVNVIHGPNGSGKTSLVEAMELAWAGTSQRKPGEVDPEDYAGALARGGVGEFAVSVDGEEVDAPAQRPRAQLSRSVLTHEAISGLASAAPDDRFSALLGVTGLQIPDLKARTERLLRESKRAADQALSAAGMENLPRANSVGLKHLREGLAADFVARHSALPDLRPLESAVATVSEGGFAVRTWPSEKRLPEALERADTAVRETIEGRRAEAAIGDVLDAAASAVDDLLAERSPVAAASRQLLLQTERGRRPASPPDRPAEPPKLAAPIGAALAVRWLNHARSLKEEAERFRTDAGDLDDEGWARRLQDYAAAIEEAAARAPRAELERFVTQPLPHVARPAVAVEAGGHQAAGFEEPPRNMEAVRPALTELADALDRHVEVLRAIARELRAHPARDFGAHAERVMDALCRFELARTLRREGPILQASERLVESLLDERLAPVVRELMAAIVRFEWYFKPLLMSSKEGQIVLAGIATDRSDLDTRLLLNSAEQTVVGLAWFLALHMLQPAERREVLVLDDPTSGLDPANTAGFASTLRAFSRLLKPRQIVLATHDDSVAAMLAEELSVVDDWPGSVQRVRVQRDANDCSVAYVEWERDSGRATEPETQRLGLFEDAPAAG